MKYIWILIFLFSQVAWSSGETLEVVIVETEEVHIVIAEYVFDELYFDKVEFFCRSQADSESCKSNVEADIEAYYSSEMYALILHQLEKTMGVRHDPSSTTSVTTVTTVVTDEFGRHSFLESFTFRGGNFEFVDE